MDKPENDGKCYLCDKIINKSAMSNHHKSCKEAHIQKNENQKNDKMTKVFHLLVEGQNNPQYWRHIQIHASCTLVDLDGFLRDIWVECCGHLSAFRIDGIDYYDESELEGKSMSLKLEQVLKSKKKFIYEYDFGDTTYLQFKMIATEESKISDKSVQVLARNLPPFISCSRCENEAKYVDNIEGEFFCEKCVRKEKFEEDELLPTPNSPRIGQCGYVGG